MNGSTATCAHGHDWLHRVRRLARFCRWWARSLLPEVFALCVEDPTKTFPEASTFFYLWSAAEDTLNMAPHTPLVGFEPIEASRVSVRGASLVCPCEVSCSVNAVVCVLCHMGCVCIGGYPTMASQERLLVWMLLRRSPHSRVVPPCTTHDATAHHICRIAHNMLAHMLDLLTNMLANIQCWIC